MTRAWLLGLAISLSGFPAWAAAAFSASFDGASGHAQVYHHSEINRTGNWTVEAWFKDLSPAGFNHPAAYLLAKGDAALGTEVPYFIRIASNRLKAGLRAGGAEHGLEHDLSSLNPALWHHVAVSFQASTRDMRLYLNGALVSQAVLGAASTGNASNLIFGRNGASNGHWTGRLDDIRLWTTVRAASDIASSYQNELPNFFSGLAGNWKFNEGSGTTAQDTGGTSQNAFLRTGAGYSNDVPSAAGDATPPSVSLTAPANGATVSGASVTVSAAAADNVAVAGVQFKLDGNNLGPEDVSSPYSVFWDTTLVSNGSHALTAVARDAAGNMATSATVAVQVSNASDTTPPVIASVSASGITSDGAVITWTTNEPSNSQVEYGTSAAYGFLSPLSTASVTSHRVALSGLLPGTVYHYRALSKDLAGNAAASPDRTFQTADSSGSTRIMPLGDSITDGLQAPGAYRTELWNKLTADGFSLDYVGSLSNGPASLPDKDHEGHSGWRIDQIAGSVNPWLAAYGPEMVLLHIGTNDMIQNYYVSTAPARLSSLIDQITAARPGAHVVVAALVPLGDSAQNARLLQYNAAIPGIVASKKDAGKNVSYVDMDGAVTAADLYDGKHPSASGHAKMAAVWHPLVRTILQTGASVGVDRSSPTVAVASPAPGATVSGAAVALSASASDNIGVVNVRFLVDGQAAGEPDFSPPYSVTWDSTRVSNGSHVVTAVARDSAGNETISSEVPISVQNASLALLSDPPGLQLTLNSARVTAPHFTFSAFGTSHAVGALSPQTRGTTGTYQESGGQVVMEAEGFSDTVARSSAVWSLETRLSGFTGQGYMVVPDKNAGFGTDYAAASPGLTFRIHFVSTGTYYIWIRGEGPDGLSDSLHAGLDGQAVSSADRISGFLANSYRWLSKTMDNARPTVNVTAPGNHVFNIWAREDGMKLDKIVLTKSSSYTPSSSGPAISSGTAPRNFEFVSWSDGGATTHTVTASQPQNSYTARYQEVISGSAAAAPSAGLTLVQVPDQSDILWGDTGLVEAVSDLEGKAVLKRVDARGARAISMARAGSRLSALLDTAGLPKALGEIRVRASIERDGEEALESEERTLRVVPSAKLRGAVRSGQTVFSLADHNPLDGTLSLRIRSDAGLDELDLEPLTPGEAESLAGTPAAAGYRVSSPKHPGPLARPAILTLLYPDRDLDAEGLPTGNGTVDGTEIKEENLRIFDCGSSPCRLLGGVVDRNKNTVTARVHALSTFVLMKGEASPAPAPQTFLTPALVDGINDAAAFGLEAQEVEIMDVTGQRVFYAVSDGLGGIVWTCRDRDGRLLPSGLYIARLKKQDGSTAYQKLIIAK
jgi:lysophospholipase L1-like esterase